MASFINFETPRTRPCMDHLLTSRRKKVEFGIPTSRKFDHSLDTTMKNYFPNQNSNKKKSTEISNFLEFENAEELSSREDTLTPRNTTLNSEIDDSQEFEFVRKCSKNEGLRRFELSRIESISERNSSEEESETGLALDLGSFLKEKIIIKEKSKEELNRENKAGRRWGLGDAEEGFEKNSKFDFLKNKEKDGNFEENFCYEKYRKNERSVDRVVDRYRKNKENQIGYSPVLKCPRVKVYVNRSPIKGSEERKKRLDGTIDEILEQSWKEINEAKEEIKMLKRTYGII